MKILIAEDNVVSRRILEVALGKWGYDVVSVTNGDDAVDMMLSENPPQLALLDWIMPGKDGIEVCRRIRQETTRIPPYIILLTSKGDKQDISIGLESGADDYIVKPYDNDELKARINVGRRVLKLQNNLVEKEKFSGVLEMAGAVCHEFNQPLMVISGYSEMLLADLPEDSPHLEAFNIISEQVTRLGKMTNKLMRITEYKTKNYLEGNIIDIDKASGKDPNDIYPL